MSVSNGGVVRFCPHGFIAKHPSPQVTAHASSRQNTRVGEMDIVKERKCCLSCRVSNAAYT